MMWWAHLIRKIGHLHHRGPRVHRLHRIAGHRLSSDGGGRSSRRSCCRRIVRMRMVRMMRIVGLWRHAEAGLMLMRMHVLLLMMMLVLLLLLMLLLHELISRIGIEVVVSADEARRRRRIRHVVHGHGQERMVGDHAATHAHADAAALLAHHLADGRRDRSSVACATAATHQIEIVDAHALRVEAGAEASGGQRGGFGDAHGQQRIGVVPALGVVCFYVDRLVVGHLQVEDVAAARVCVVHVAIVQVLFFVCLIVQYISIDRVNCQRN